MKKLHHFLFNPPFAAFLHGLGLSLAGCGLIIDIPHPGLWYGASAACVALGLVLNALIHTSSPQWEGNRLQTVEGPGGMVFRSHEEASREPWVVALFLDPDGERHYQTVPSEAWGKSIVEAWSRQEAAKIRALRRGQS